MDSANIAPSRSENLLGNEFIQNPDFLENQLWQIIRDLMCLTIGRPHGALSWQQVVFNPKANGPGRTSLRNHDVRNLLKLSQWETKHVGYVSNWDASLATASEAPSESAPLVRRLKTTALGHPRESAALRHRSESSALNFYVSLNEVAPHSEAEKEISIRSRRLDVFCLGLMILEALSQSAEEHAAAFRSVLESFYTESQGLGLTHHADSGLTALIELQTDEKIKSLLALASRMLQPPKERINQTSLFIAFSPLVKKHGIKISLVEEDAIERASLAVEGELCQLDDKALINALVDAGLIRTYVKHLFRMLEDNLDHCKQDLYSFLCGGGFSEKLVQLVLHRRYEKSVQAITKSLELGNQTFVLPQPGEFFYRDVSPKVWSLLSKVFKGLSYAKLGRGGKGISIKGGPYQPLENLTEDEKSLLGNLPVSFFWNGKDACVVQHRNSEPGRGKKCYLGYGGSHKVKFIADSRGNMAVMRTRLRSPKAREIMDFKGVEMTWYVSNSLIGLNDSSREDLVWLLMQIAMQILQRPHGDIKPANVLIQEVPGQKIKARVIDWDFYSRLPRQGFLAPFTYWGHRVGVSQQTEGEMIRDVAYKSQDRVTDVERVNFRHRAEQLVRRLDVFSLGVTILQILVPSLDVGEHSNLESMFLRPDLIAQGLESIQLLLDKQGDALIVEKSLLGLTIRMLQKPSERMSMSEVVEDLLRLGQEIGVALQPRNVENMRLAIKASELVSQCENESKNPLFLEMDEFNAQLMHLGLNVHGLNEDGYRKLCLMVLNSSGALSLYDAWKRKENKGVLQGAGAFFGSQNVSDLTQRVGRLQTPCEELSSDSGGAAPAPG